jgi:hypothetical protein
MARTYPRRRHYVDSRLLALLRPAFRYSDWRDAYVLRGVGSALAPW